MKKVKYFKKDYEKPYLEEFTLKESSVLTTASVKGLFDEIQFTDDGDADGWGEEHND